MRRVSALLLHAALLPLAAFGPSHGAHADDPEVFALVFAAEWCGACKALDPNLRAARADLAEEAVAFVTLDPTTADARRQSARYTAAYGAHEDKTGFGLLLDARSRRVLDRIPSADSRVQTAQKARRAIAAA